MQEGFELIDFLDAQGLGRDVERRVLAGHFARVGLDYEINLLQPWGAGQVCVFAGPICFGCYGIGMMLDHTFECWEGPVMPVWRG